MIYQSWDPVVCHSHNLAACTKVVVVFKEVVSKEVAIKELESLGEDLTACLRLVDRSRELTMVRESEIQCFLATLEKEQEGVVAMNVVCITQVVEEEDEVDVAEWEAWVKVVVCLVGQDSEL
jgi:hypothetical protein